MSITAFRRNGPRSPRSGTSHQVFARDAAALEWPRRPRRAARTQASTTDRQQARRCPRHCQSQRRIRPAGGRRHGDQTRPRSQEPSAADDPERNREQYCGQPSFRHRHRDQSATRSSCAPAPALAAGSSSSIGGRAEHHRARAQHSETNAEAVRISSVTTAWIRRQGRLSSNATIDVDTAERGVGEPLGQGTFVCREPAASHISFAVPAPGCSRSIAGPAASMSTIANLEPRPGKRSATQPAAGEGFHCWSPPRRRR